MVRRVWLVWLLLLASAPARAEPPPVWLERFDVARGCPDRRAFQRAVGERVARSLDVAFAELRLGISIERDPAADSRGLLGSLDITDAAGHTTSRELRASSCPELLQALSLLAAVAADAASPSNDAPLSTSGARSGRDPALAARLAAEPARDLATAPRSGPEDVRLGPSLYVLLQNTTAPNPELGFGAAVSVSWPAHGYWAPTLQLGAYRVQSRQLSVGTRSIQARFELIAAHAVACPLRLPARGVWSLSPCLEVDVGELGGEGEGSALTTSSDRAGVWASSALSLRGEIQPWTPLSVSASVGAVLPWTRHEFYFAPDTEAFSVPRLGFRGTLAGALMF